MTCTEFERLLDQKEPDAQTAEAMQRHAEQCEHCRMLMELRALDTGEEVPEEVSVRWRAALRTEQAKQRERGRKGLFQYRFLAPLAAAMAVLVAAVALRGSVTDVEKAKKAALPTQTAAVEAREEPAEPAKSVENSIPAMATPITSGLSTAMPTRLPAFESAASEPAGDFAAMESVPAMENEEDIPADEAAFEDEPVDEAAAEEPAGDEAAFEDEPVDEAAAEESAGDEVLLDGDFDVPMFAEPFNAKTMDQTAKGRDVVTLTWTAGDPEKTAVQLTEALAKTGCEAEMAISEDGSAHVSLAVAGEQWPAVRDLIAQAGYAGSPALDEISFGGSGSVYLTLNIEKEEKP